MTDAPQLCVHLTRHGRGTRTVTANNMPVELCKRCQQELASRLGETDQPETPIESYAKTQEVVMQNGCTYETRKEPVSYCRLVCDEGQTMCPRHVLIFAAEEQKKRNLAHAKEMYKTEITVQAMKGGRR